jgi:Amiloride-sensitive sodium channel
MFMECRFKNQTMKCLESVREVVGSFAMCYNFNGLDIFRKRSISQASEPLDWSIDDGYKATGSLDMYPRRASGAGPHFGFSALLRMSKYDIDYRCSMNPGFYVKE